MGERAWRRWGGRAVIRQGCGRGCWRTGSRAPSVVLVNEGSCASPGHCLSAPRPHQDQTCWALPRAASLANISAGLPSSMVWPPKKPALHERPCAIAHFSSSLVCHLLPRTSCPLHHPRPSSLCPRRRSCQCGKPRLPRGVTGGCQRF